MTTTAQFDDQLDALGLATRTDDNGMHVRLPTRPALGLFITSLIIGIVVAGFAYPIAAMLWHPHAVPPAVIAAGIAAVLTIAITLGLRRRGQIQRGDCDLVIDVARRLVTLPIGYGRDARVELEFDDIIDVYPADEAAAAGGVVDAEALGAKKYTRRDPDAMVFPRGHRGTMQHAVIVESRGRTDEDIVRHLLVRWGDAQRTIDFAQWFQLMTGVGTS